MYLDVSGTWIFQKSSLYKYQNKNKQTWNHYLSKTYWARFFQPYLLQTVFPLTISLTLSTFSGTYLRWISQISLVTAGSASGHKWQFCSPLCNEFCGRGREGKRLRGSKGWTVTSSVFFRRLGKYCCLCSLCVARTLYPSPKSWKIM